MGRNALEAITIAALFIVLAAGPSILAKLLPGR